jgi:hypothetical protein
MMFYFFVAMALLSWCGVFFHARTRNAHGMAYAGAMVALWGGLAWWTA